ncbi:MAG TPA: DSD1 family PLP-dependent enzyme [Acetobacteraceae bacterium]|jgi:D-serine deaminase-like pyridoxal phosphate-dependent protein|nr:DSD1 family PLP-dependent enzyme [Acetobacteraceae bacterium]
MVAASLIGAPKTDVDTPALLVDLDVMEANIRRVAETCRAHGVGWRPHTKGQKTPEIIHKELAAGAIGVTCAKLGEAEVLATIGIRDILIANQIVGPAKMRRLLELTAIADPIVAVDNVMHVTELGAAMESTGRTLRIVIEVDIGMHRAGVLPGAPVVTLARAVAAEKGLRFVGVMGWESHAVTIAEPSEKARVVAAAIALLTSSADACRAAGLPVDIVSCGGTGTFPWCAQQPGVTEIEAGGAIFSDMHYRTHYHLDFPPALTLLATVTSRPTDTRVIIDAGKKAMSSDAAAPMPLGVVAERVGLSAEHGTIVLAEANDKPRIGDKLELIVGYSDTTVHLHEEIVAVRNGRIEAVWCIAGRGRIK